MARYSYQTRSDLSSGWRGGPTLRFHVLDTQRRSDSPIAVCHDRDDAEKIVEALNILLAFGASDALAYGIDPPREWDAI